MIVALAGKLGLVPFSETVGGLKIDFKMDVRAFLGNARAGVRGTSHRGDDLALLNGMSDLQAGSNGAEMGVNRENRDSFDLVPQNNIASIIRESHFFIDVSNRPGSGGKDRVRRFAMLVALQAFDIQSFVELETIGAHAAEGPASPIPARRGHEVLI